MAAAVSMIAVYLLLLALFSGHVDAFSIMNYLCNNVSSYSMNSTYHSNVVTLLSSLSANASSSPVGFATGTIGAATSEQAWGLTLCRGDINGSSCASCLSLASDYAMGNDGKCRGVKDVSIYFDSCLLRYSGKDFLASPDEVAGEAQYSPNMEVNITVNPGRFVELAADLVGALSDWAANNSTARFATGVMNCSGETFTTTSFDLVSNIYGLVQCTPNQAPEACKACLGRYRDAMPAVLNGTAGGQVNAVWCNLRYEIFNFYGSTPPVVNLVAPPPSPPPSAPSPVDQNDAEEDGDTGSLLFDLTTGFLPDGQQIAVKRLDKDSGQGLNELRNELLLVAKLRHNNLAKLLGVCLKGREKLLVYEYLPNRSLDTFLFEPEKRQLLDWDTRFEISSILSLSSRGYMAPEYAVLGHLSVKLDVYSFGVLVLEIVAGRKNTDMWFESETNESGTLLSYAWDQWMKGTPLDAMDPSLDCQAPESEVLKCVHLGLLCVQENPADRPTMLDVLMMLHGNESNFPTPSKPAFTFALGDLSSARSDGVSQGSGVQRAAATPTPSVNGMSVSEFSPR
ncbi:hypothetical protein PR202_gb11470 [Eleusine coracana subsp. coracana]|uniref:Gnk2-homologous domain-containing protein n=1 Tax=Eleusine coracana subsp. coracana TaxID=191504 RepID=A0AAV5ENT2_ELECO|nr:hypothetical protein PR202_gb11470 [Eleusine coracana subsp. coracana]